MKNMNETQTTIGEIVANDFRTASVFTGAGIDFCCGGYKTLAESCAEQGIPVDELEKRLEEIRKSDFQPATNYNEWDLIFLSDYIKNTHHRFVLKTLPELLFYTDKISRVHGDRHPELYEIAALMKNLNEELMKHLKQEEEVLFPAIRDAVSQKTGTATAVIESEISRMTGEHEIAGGTMDEINRMTNRYKVPADGCNTYHAAFKLLWQFEEDLHIHVHLENNILFPKALRLAEN